MLCLSRRKGPSRPFRPMQIVLFNLDERAHSEIMPSEGIKQTGINKLDLLSIGFLKIASQLLARYSLTKT